MPFVYTPHPITANIQNVTAARAIGPVYTNTSSRPILALVSFTHRVTILNRFLLTQLSVNPGGGQSWGGWFNTPAAGSELYSTMAAMIPPGATYQVTENATGGVNTLLRWIEVTL